MRRSGRPRALVRGWASQPASASMSANDARFAGTTCSSAPGPADSRYRSRYKRRRAGVSVDVATTTVAPPRSSRRTSSAAIEPGLAPVTSAVSPRRSGQPVSASWTSAGTSASRSSGHGSAVAWPARHGAQPVGERAVAAAGQELGRACQDRLGAVRRDPSQRRVVELAAQAVVVGGDEVPARARPGRGEADVAAVVEAGRHLLRATGSELVVEQGQALALGVRLRRRHVGGRAARHDRLRSRERDRRVAGGRRSRPGERDAERLAGQRGRRVDELATAGRARRGGLGQATERAAARRRPRPRLEREQREHVVGETGTETPRARQVSGRVGARQARAAERPRQPGGDGVAQVRAGEAIARRPARAARARARRSAVAARPRRRTARTRGRGRSAPGCAATTRPGRARRAAPRVELVEPHPRLGGEHEPSAVPASSGRSAGACVPPSSGDCLAASSRGQTLLDAPPKRAGQRRL